MHNTQTRTQNPNFLVKPNPKSQSPTRHGLVITHHNYLTAGVGQCKQANYRSISAKCSLLGCQALQCVATCSSKSWDLDSSILGG